MNNESTIFQSGRDWLTFLTLLSTTLSTSCAPSGILLPSLSIIAPNSCSFSSSSSDNGNAVLFSAIACCMDYGMLAPIYEHLHGLACAYPRDDFDHIQHPFSKLLIVMKYEYHYCVLAINFIPSIHMTKLADTDVYQFWKSHFCNSLTKVGSVYTCTLHGHRHTYSVIIIYYLQAHLPVSCYLPGHSWSVLRYDKCWGDNAEVVTLSGREMDTLNWRQ